MHSGPESRSTARDRHVLTFRGLVIDVDARRVICDDVERSLTKSEFDLLLELARNAGTVLSSEQLFRAVWGSDWVGDGHAVEVQISRLRAKLGESSKAQRFVKTVRSVGYRLDADSVGGSVTITYDAELRVTAIDPYDRPFFGWDPQDIIGTFFLLGFGPMSEVSQPEAIAIIKAVAATNPTQMNHAFDVRCADGSTESRNAFSQVLSDEAGAFAGWRLTLH